MITIFRHDQILADTGRYWKILDMMYKILDTGYDYWIVTGYRYWI